MAGIHIVSIADRAAREFQGDINDLERAVGMLMVGCSFGWRTLYLTHSKATIRKYERILGIKIRQVLPETGELTERSQAWQRAKKLSNFWKVAKGEIPGIKTPHIYGKRFGRR